MDLEMQKSQINELWTLLVNKEEAVNKHKELMRKYESGLEDAAQWGLPIAPKQPKEPKMPSRPKPIEADTKIKAKDFALADAIRSELLAQGIILEDTREGVKWKRA